MDKKFKDLSDEELASHVALGEHEAFSILVKRISSRAYAFVYRFLRDQAEAEDLVQEAFLKYWRKPDSFDPSKKIKFMTWFMRILKNLCLDYCKKMRPLLDNEKDQEVSYVAGQEIEVEEKKKKMIRWMSSLPENQRLAINMYYYESYSQKEAADVLDVNVKAFESLLSRAKKKLKETWASFNKLDEKRKKNEID